MSDFTTPTVENEAAKRFVGHRSVAGGPAFADGVNDIDRTFGAAGMHRADFDDLALIPARRIEAAPATFAELDGLIALAGRLIPPLAAAAPAIHRVHRRNPNSIWAARREGTAVGVVALLILNQAGLDALNSGSLDTTEPSVEWLASAEESAEAIYFWAVATPGFAVESLRSISRWLTAPRYALADLYTRTTTPSGTRLTVNLGFKMIPELGLYWFQRHCNRREENVA